MAYTKQTFVNNETVLTADHLNHIEDGIYTNSTNIGKKQSTLVSGNNIKTVNGQSILGSGNLVIGDGSASIEAGSRLRLNGKKVIIFGDSIMEQATCFRNAFVELTGAQILACFAISGASLRMGSNQSLDGNPSYGSNSSVPNQVQKLLNTHTEYDTPDIIIVSASTNDGINSNEPTKFDETQFTSNNTDYIDVDTCDLASFSGAMRWIYEKLRSIYPDALIVFCTPIQAKTASSVSRHFGILKIKRDVMISVCERMSVPYIDAFTKSGIYSKFEANSGNGKHLRDGIHPNAEGAKILAKCYARELEHLISLD